MGPLPNQREARRLVISVAIFWAAWAVAVASARLWRAVAISAVVIGLVSGFVFYFTLFKMWAREGGESLWRFMFVPSRAQFRAGLYIFDVLRPSWIRSSLRTTGWSLKFVGFGLLALLMTDLILAVTLLPHIQSE